ncbi:glycine zipper 2TM domain-containing protein [Sphingobium sp. CR2-8]|uniref:glycine zipper 2TM domain-containing protein n=1 Tax=Sphingobium sp. CR2-8 TaxID=1306534 RepID=UPI002DBC7AC7|nr:glycine zipper 2TM domain-containing protein [Sphingobium sp. CR2-8]MEC3912388.1 glycine zipper 2TM domain-containing protein [Sphingobium sp. CR2-8]
MFIRKAILATALAAASLGAVTPTIASARDHDHDRRGYREYRGDRDYRGDRYADRRGYRDDRGYRCRKSGGTTGLLVGGVAGALLGRAVDTRGDRAPGTIIGAGAGALAGRAIDRNSKC